VKFSIPIRSFIGETHGIKQSREESNSTSGKNSKAVSESMFKRQMRRAEPVYIYIPISLCVCFKATYFYYTYFVSSPRNVREIYHNIHVCVCYSNIDISRHLQCSPRNARVICNIYVDL
jgi:hypothetical protein